MSNHYVTRELNEQRPQWSHMTLQNYFTKATNKIIKTNYESVGEKENLMSRTATVCYSTCPVFNQKTAIQQRNKSMVHP